MSRMFARVAVSLAILFALLSAVQPSPVHAAASIVDSEWGGCWNCASLNSVYLYKSVASGDAIVVGVGGYAPCPASGCPPTGGPNQVLGASSLSVSDSIGSTFTQVVAEGMPTSSNKVEEFVAIYVATAPVSASGDFAKLSLPYAAQELDLYIYDVAGVLANVNIPYSAGAGSGYGVHINSVGFSQYPGAFLLGILGTECPPYGTYGQPIVVFPGTGYTLSTYIASPNPPNGQCSSLHAEYSTSGAETNGFTTFPATIAGTSQTPNWVEVGIVLNSHFQAYSTTSAESTTYPTATSQGASTDWAVVQVWVDPSLPTEGTPVRLGMTISALSTTGGYPQRVTAHCTIDGSSCGSGGVDYAGPTGATITVSANSRWNAVSGTHTLSWELDATNDPNPSNNAMSISFRVQSSTSQSTTTTKEAVTSSGAPVTVVQTETLTQQPISTTSQFTQPGVADMLQQNSLPVIAALAAIVVALALAMMRRGRKSGPGTSPAKPSS